MDNNFVDKKFIYHKIYKLIGPLNYILNKNTEEGKNLLNVNDIILKTKKINKNQKSKRDWYEIFMMLFFYYIYIQLKIKIINILMILIII